VTSQTIPVHLIGGLGGANKSLKLTLSGAVNATLGRTGAERSAERREAALPSVSFQHATASGPASQNAGRAVTLSAAANRAATADYTASGTAVAGTAYTLPQPQTIACAPGATSQTIPVHLIGDGLAGPNKTLKLALSGPINATLGRTGTE